MILQSKMSDIEKKDQPKDQSIKEAFSQDELIKNLKDKKNEADKLVKAKPQP